MIINFIRVSLKVILGFIRVSYHLGQGVDPREGLPEMRRPWVERRAGDAVVTQMHYARQACLSMTELN